MTTTPPLLTLIEGRQADIETALQELEHAGAPGALVLLRQLTLLTDLHEAVAEKIGIVDFAFEGEFDPLAEALDGEGTPFDRNLVCHKEALQAIAPIIATARAQGLVVHTPELAHDVDQAPEDAQAEDIAELHPNGN